MKIDKPIFFSTLILVTSLVWVFTGGDQIASSAPKTEIAQPENSIDRPVDLTQTESNKEDPIVNDFAVKYYVKKYKVTWREASRRIAIQDKASGIEDKIDELLGENFAGVWYDPNRGGKLQIGLVPAARKQMDGVKRIIKDLNLGSSAEIASVQYTVTDLQSIQSRVSGELKDLISSGFVRTGYNPRMNSVRISAAKKLKPADEARLKKVSSMPGVRVRRINSDSLKAKLNQCAVRKCDPPMRGGREIISNGLCTSAFVASFGDNPSVKGVITAGHCVFAGGGINADWSSSDQSGSIHVIGPARKFFFAGSTGEDEGMIRINTGGFWNSPAPVGKVVVKASDDTTYNPDYHIHTDSASSIGQILCMTGRTTGTHCGEVGDLGEEITADLLGQSFDLKNMGELEACEAQGGDSGGPLYKNNKAFGIHSASGGSIFDCDEFYQGIRGAQKSLNVKLVFNP